MDIRQTDSATLLLFFSSFSCSVHTQRERERERSRIADAVIHICKTRRRRRRRERIFFFFFFFESRTLVWPLSLSRMYVVYTIRHNHALTDTRSTCGQLENGDYTRGPHRSSFSPLLLLLLLLLSPTKQITQYSPSDIPPPLQPVGYCTFKYKKGEDVEIIAPRREVKTMTRLQPAPSICWLYSNSLLFWWPGYVTAAAVLLLWSSSLLRAHRLDAENLQTANACSPGLEENNHNRATKFNDVKTTTTPCSSFLGLY